jgi:hypothetical protein
MYAVTLGEAGVVYWRRLGGSELAGPMWARLVDDGGRLGGVAPADLRNGLGCGDVARAGMTAAILLLGRGAGGEVCWDHAVAWGNYFGAAKVRFFGVEDFLSWLHSRAGVILAAMTSSRGFGPGSRVKMPPEDPGKVESFTDHAIVNGDLLSDLKSHLHECRALIDPRSRERFEKAISEWRIARQLNIADTGGTRKA